MIGNTLEDKSSFTLIELLVVVAIIAILSVFVILTINPAELLKQGRDSQRVSDIATINSALNLYQVDQVTGSLGTASTTYISIPDNTATSTAGDQCQGLSLPALPSGWTYHCAASSTYRNTDGTGWIPVNFTSISYGSPLGSLPTDPINSSSTAYYTYTPGGSWQLTAIPESQKIRTTQANSLTGAITQGSNLSLSPLFSSNGLVGYWKFDETSGATSTDSSGNGNNGTWVGTSNHWTTGKIGGAGQFSGSVDSVWVTGASKLNITGPITFSVWINTNSTYPSNYGMLFEGSDLNSYLTVSDGNINLSLSVGGIRYTLNSWIGGGSGIPVNTWSYAAATWDGSTMKIYVNGVLRNSGGPYAGALSITTGSMAIGQYAGANTYYFNGLIDDARIYNRALSAAEIMALYNATK